MAAPSSNQSTSTTGTSGSSGRTRWELAATPSGKWRDARSPGTGARWLLGVCAAIGCLGLALAIAWPRVPAFLPSGIVTRVALALLSVGCVAVPFTRRAARRRVTQPSSYLEANADGLSRVTALGTKSLLRWDTPFGVTLFASYGRPTALLAFTSPTQTRYVPTRIDERSEADDALLARIAVLADLDLVDGIRHDDALPSSSAAELVRHLEFREKQSLGRVFLSDSRRAPISLDRATLAVGERAFDLSSPLEWRALMFHESTGQGAALYQATWVRQGTNELVLVAPMPASIVPRDPQDAGTHRDAAGKLGQTLTRDLKLLQAPAESPPAREMRVAIDRPFMMAVRRALADAPLASRSPTSQTSRTSPAVRGHVP